MNDEQKKWNEKLKNTEGCFLQSYDWGIFQKKMGQTIEMYEDDKINALIIRKKLPLKKEYIYVPRGPFVIDFNEKRIKDFAIKLKKQNSKNVVFLRIEPFLNDSSIIRENLLNADYKETESLQPKQTLCIDLLKDERDLLSEMEHDTRYSIRASERRGVVVKKVSEINEKKNKFEEFWKLFLETNSYHKLESYPKKYYEELAMMEGECNSSLFFAEYDNKIISTALVLYFNKTATYLYAASLRGYGKYNAPSLVLWNIIIDAKKNGYKNFDMWGISDEKKEWSGLTSFKKSFGGESVKYVGTWDFVFNKGWYMIYNLAKKIL